MDTQSYNFQEFRAPSGRATPFVTLNKNGRIYLSTATTGIYEITGDTYPAVKMYYDPDNKIVAIKPIPSKEDGSLPLKVPKNGGAFINATSFATKYDLMAGAEVRPEYVGKYIAEKKKIDGIGNVLLVDLTKRHK